MAIPGSAVMFWNAAYYLSSRIMSCVFHYSRIKTPSWSLYNRYSLQVRLQWRLLERYQVQGFSCFYPSLLNSAFKYWLESNLKERLKRKGAVLPACMPRAGMTSLHRSDAWKILLQQALFVASGFNPFHLLNGASFLLFYITEFYLKYLTTFRSSTWLPSLVMLYCDVHYSSQTAMHFQPRLPFCDEMTDPAVSTSLFLDGPIYRTRNQPSPHLNAIKVWAV